MKKTLTQYLILAVMMSLLFILVAMLPEHSQHEKASQQPQTYVASFDMLGNAKQKRDN